MSHEFQDVMYPVVHAHTSTIRCFMKHHHQTDPEQHLQGHLFVGSNFQRASVKILGSAQPLAEFQIQRSPEAQLASYHQVFGISNERIA